MRVELLSVLAQALDSASQDGQVLWLFSTCCRFNLYLIKKTSLSNVAKKKVLVQNADVIEQARDIIILRHTEIEEEHTS